MELRRQIVARRTFLEYKDALQHLWMKDWVKNSLTWLLWE